MSFFFFFNSKSWKGSNWCSPRDCPAHQGILLAGGESATLLLLNLERMAPYHGDDSSQLEGEDLSSALCSLLAIYFLWIDILLLCSLQFAFLQVHIPTSLGRASRWWNRCAPGQWAWISSWLKRAGDPSYLHVNSLTVRLCYESWELWIHSYFLCQGAMGAAMHGAHLNAIIIK